MTLLLTTQAEPYMGDTSSLTPALIVFLLLIAFCIMTIRNSSKAKKAIKQESKNRNASVTATFPHVHGLPIAENVSCTIFSTPERYEIEAQGNSFNLDKNKVTDVCIKTDKEITSQYVSSVGGAVGGAVLFGPLGAVVGGRAKKKKSVEVHQYLIITYESDNEIKYIGFAMNNIYKATLLVEEFKATGNKHTATVNL